MADKSITKTELVASIASATGESQATVSRVLDSLFGTVSDAVAKGSKVSMNNYTLVQRDQVVAIEIYAAYQPIIWPELFAESSMMQGYVYSLYRPRYGSFQFEPR